MDLLYKLQGTTGSTISLLLNKCVIITLISNINDVLSYFVDG